MVNSLITSLLVILSCTAINNCFAQDAREVALRMLCKDVIEVDSNAMILSNEYVHKLTILYDAKRRKPSQNGNVIFEMSKGNYINKYAKLKMRFTAIPKIDLSKSCYHNYYISRSSYSPTEDSLERQMNEQEREIYDKLELDSNTANAEDPFYFIKLNKMKRNTWILTSSKSSLKVVLKFPLFAYMKILFSKSHPTDLKEKQLLNFIESMCFGDGYEMYRVISL